MRKTDAPKAPLKAFNPKATKAVSAYMDVPRMVLDGNLAALKAASILKINLSAPYQVQSSNHKTVRKTQLITLAMEAGQKDVFDLLVTSQRTNLNVISTYQHGPQGITHPERGTPLDAAYNLKRHNVEGGAYYYEQLIANGARLAVGKHAAEIKKDLPKTKAAAEKPSHKIIGQAIGRPARN